jgi:hypothetical protein
VRSPHDREYGYDPDKWTPTQEEQWDAYNRQEAAYFDFQERLHRGDITQEGSDYIDEEGEVIAPKHVRLSDLGGVGSGKTHMFGGVLAATQVQKYPGSIGLMAANTYEQAERGPLPEFKKVMERLGYSWQDATYHKEKIVRGTPYKRIIVIQLSDSQTSYIRIGSFHNATNLESEEFDWAVCSEIQDAAKENFLIAYRRVRTTYANNAIFAEGTPKKKTHWQYDLIDNLGFETWYSDTRDNPHKVAGYAENLKKGYPKHLAEAYITGDPIEKSADAIFHCFDWERHVEEVPEGLREHDPDKPLHICFDFNLSPMSVTLWQKKDGSPYVGYADEVWAQVDEIEKWEGGTRTAAEAAFQVAQRQGIVGGIVKGDATGSGKDTKSPDKSDWDIIRNVFADLPNFKIQPGIKPGNTDDEGRMIWNNPEQRSRNMAGNTLLEDGRGLARVVFADSELDSGGCAASVSDLEKGDDGGVAKRKDKTKDRTAVQSHFAETFAYHAYDVLRKKGVLGGSKPADKAAKEHDNLVISGESTFETGGFGGESSSLTW